MGLGIFLIPTLMGYLLLRALNFTRFIIARDAGYHVLFKSAIAGGILVGISHGIILTINRVGFNISDKWGIYVDYQFSDTVALSVLIGILAWLIGNRVYSKDKAAKAIATNNGDLIELLIRESMEDQNLIEISLKTGKSYIGFAVESGIAKSGESDISLIPIESGYRDKDTKELEITTYYSLIIAESHPDAKSYLDYADFQIIIPKSEIISVRLFDPDVYQRFQRDRNPPLVTPPGATTGPAARNPAIAPNAGRGGTAPET